MGERDGYQPGVPWWVDTWQPDAERAVSFYTELFGWEVEDTTPFGASGRYLVCKLRGRDVAAIGSPPREGAPAVPAWETYICVESAEETARKATAAGGRIVTGPFDSFDGGRMAILADPSGVSFGVWRPDAHQGVQLVNEP